MSGVAAAPARSAGGARARADRHALANLTSYPWTVGRTFGWGELVLFSSDVPTFPGCRRAFLAGLWFRGQLGPIETSAGSVRILNVIPVSEAEREQVLVVRPELFFKDLLDRRDVLAPPVTQLA
ncbi:suppressor of fused domain protein [Streptacidiphilus sp. EB103A]|uniref:suppressor of fused domain protein n=1 Tax=Streptacidiphilus sp. EB103A TaxID=3156275 RepID=UPI00351514BA